MSMLCNPGLHFFIPTRDRLVVCQQLVEWLLEHDQEKGKIHLVDMESTYQPMVEWLKKQKEAGFNVVFLKNKGSRSLLKRGCHVERVVGLGKPYFVSDPDVLPEPSCRSDLLGYMVACLDRFPKLSRLGLSLRINDLPAHYPHKKHIEDFESRYWKKVVRKDFYEAATATTFCILRRLESSWHGWRTAPPNIARHTAWYLDPNNLSEDEAHYYSRVPKRRGNTPGTSQTWHLGN